MPVYNSRCPKCDTIIQYVATIDKCEETPICGGCEIKTKKIITATKINIPFPATMDRYRSPASGEIIDSVRKRNDDFKKTGTRPTESIESEKRQAEANKKYKQEQAEKQRKKVMEKVFRDHMGDKVISK